MFLFEGGESGFGFGVFEHFASSACTGVTSNNFVPNGVGDFGGRGSTSGGFDIGVGTCVLGGTRGVVAEGVGTSDGGGGDTGADGDTIGGVAVDKIVFDDVIGDTCA